MTAMEQPCLPKRTAETSLSSFLPVRSIEGSVVPTHVERRETSSDRSASATCARGRQEGTARISLSLSTFQITTVPVSLCRRSTHCPSMPWWPYTFRVHSPLPLPRIIIRRHPMNRLQRQGAESARLHDRALHRSVSVTRQPMVEASQSLSLRDLWVGLLIPHS